MPYQVPELIALAAAAAIASGLNAYASVVMLGLLHRYAVVTLPPPMDTLAHPVVIGVGLALYAIEFGADKIPYLDTVWDAVHTFIRIPIGALLAAGLFHQFEPHWQIIMAMAGGFLSFQAHGTKASIRLAANASPEPFSNWALSLAEDALAVFLVWFGARHPYLALVLVAVMAVVFFFLLRLIFRTMARLCRRLFSGPTPAPPPAAAPPRS